MPNATREQTVQAINEVLAQMNPPGEAIANLDTDALSNPAWSCNNFSPAVLDRICTITETNPDNLNTVRYARDGDLPDNFNDGAFVNISMLGDPSGLNHNFNILVSGETTYLIQVFVDHQVNIVRRFNNADFIQHWHNLSDNANWANSYEFLFGVAPAAVVDDLPAGTWLQEQFVTQ